MHPCSQTDRYTYPYKTQIHTHTTQKETPLENRQETKVGFEPGWHFWESIEEDDASSRFSWIFVRQNESVQNCCWGGKACKQKRRRDGGHYRTETCVCVVREREERERGGSDGSASSSLYKWTQHDMGNKLHITILSHSFGYNRGKFVLVISLNISIYKVKGLILRFWFIIFFSE